MSEPLDLIDDCENGCAEGDHLFNDCKCDGDDCEACETYDAGQQATWAQFKAEQEAKPKPAPKQDKAPAPQERQQGKGFRVPEIVAFLEERYELMCSTAGEAYALPKAGIRLPVSMGKTGGALKGKLRLAIWEAEGKSVDTESLNNALEIARAKAYELGERVHMHLRSVHLDGRVVLDLAQPGNTRCVIITDKGWTVEGEPPAGVMFDRKASSQPLPEPVVGGSFKPLQDVLGLAKPGHWDLVRGWLVASLLSDIPRPCLLFLGAAGSAKTSRAKAIVDVLDPRDELGGSFGRNLDDDRTKALNRYLVGYDNLSRMSQEVSDHLCRLVTGDSSEKRANYTDGDSYVMSYRRTGVMTAITLPAMKSDALERFIPLDLPTLTTGRKSEWLINAELAEAHPHALGAVCDGVVTMLAGLPELIKADPEGPRMKDYWLALLAYDKACAEAYEHSAGNVLLTAAEEDPFVQVVSMWLEQRGGWWQGTPRDAYTEASKVRGDQGTGTGFDDWWPKSERAFTAELKKQSRPLQELGIRVHRPDMKVDRQRAVLVGQIEHENWADPRWADQAAGAA